MPLNSAGDLDRKIQIQMRADTLNAIGEPEAAWITLPIDGSPWANVRPMRSGEIMAGAKVFSESSKVFTIRYRTDLDTTMRIIFESKAFDIQQISEVAGTRGDALELYAKAVQ